MQIKEIQKGKKYYHTVAGARSDRGTGKRVRETNAVYVVEVDIEKRKVCASINGAPAQWYDGNIYGRWKTDLPINKKDNKKKCKTKL